MIADTVHFMEQEITRRLKQAQCEYTYSQIAALRAIAEHEGLSQTMVVNKTGIDRSTLADLVHRLLKRGLVSRKRTKEDARAYAVRLTDAGRLALKHSAPLLAKVESSMLADYPDLARLAKAHHKAKPAPLKAAA
jgi:DNA-binding MarR family transcriptional regulator